MSTPRTRRAGPLLRRHHEHRWRALMPWADKLFGTNHCQRRPAHQPRRNATSLVLALQLDDNPLN